MRPSFLQAAVAAAVTSVAVAKERKEREEGEVAASRVQSSPFLFFFPRQSLRSSYSLSLSFSFQFTEKVLLRYHRGLVCFAHSFCLPHRSISSTSPSSLLRGWSPGRYNSISSYVAPRPSGALSLYRGLANRISIY